MDDTPQQEPERVCIYGKCGKPAHPDYHFDFDLQDGKSPIRIDACSKDHLQQLKIMFFGMRKGMENAEWIICTRRRMLAIRKLANSPDNPTSLYHGQRILAFHERVGDDNRWHAQVVLADRAYVFLEEPEWAARSRRPAASSRRR